MTMILCARVSWPVPAVRVMPTVYEAENGTLIMRNAVNAHNVSIWRCSWCGARVKVVA